MATLFTNGKIFLSGVAPGTNAGLHRPPTFASCMLISGPEILHVGSPTDSPITSYLSAHPSTPVHSLAGKTLLPGFIDGHMHLTLLGQALTKLDLSGCTSLASIQAAVRSYAAANPSLPRILCRGWMHSMLPPDRPPHARDLDGLDPTGRDRAVLMDSKDLHSTWANTKGIQELGAENWGDVPGGIIGRDEEGRLTGVFSEAANIGYVWPFLAGVAGLGERVAAIREAVREYYKAGYTGVVDMAMDEAGWEALQMLRGEEKGVGLRVAAYWLVKPCEEVGELLRQVERAVELAREFNAETSPDCRVVGIKVICDGIVDACTAGLAEPYAHNGHVEVPVWTEEQLVPVVKRADEAGLQIALHAIGDATVKLVVDVLTKHASPARRPRVEHLEVTTPEDVARLGAAGITASIQPVHADPAILKAWPRLLGEHRCGRAFAYREFADLGAPLALGSDAPTAPHSPLGNIYVGTTRRSYREPDMETTVNPHFALGLCEAVAAATEGAAYSCFDEHRIGVLAAGRRADFVVVDMEWEKEKLMGARVVKTWYDGVKVFSAEGEVSP
ncbi:amidohydrolase 3 [Staphylotrichum tortipilum]|uniref:Amidohydrolase 3 n=1 Tax=Staphylotrichum tortipilum TaxID=2831512 RepID=A0AAN6MCJ9_9PEZI|nr:amidohydrolase 3 [Staphylotrichum longicolle]